MREIKFRAWDRAKNMMVNPIVDENKTDGTAWLDINNAFDFTEHNYELMQFTGLKDKNGKEIFEGDITEGATHNFKVIFNKGSFGFVPINYHGDNGNEVFISACLTRGIKKVVGNIYENPEFLGGQQ